jgi:hypothetical protein
VTFITYSLTGHDLDPATIFPALQFFSVISGAINHIPPQLSNMLDARVAVGEIFSTRMLIPLNPRPFERSAGGMAIDHSFVIDTADGNRLRS